MSKKYAIFTSVGSSDQVLDEDVVSHTPGESFDSRLQTAAEHMSKSRVTGIDDDFVPAIIIKTEKITIKQISTAHDKVLPSLRAASKDIGADSAEAISVSRHYAIVAGQTGYADPNSVPPELMTIVYEIGDSEETTDMQSNRRCVVKMLGSNYGILKSQKSSGIQFVDADEVKKPASKNKTKGKFDKKASRAKLKSVKSRVVTSEMQAKNAETLIKLCKENGFSDRVTANFVGMAMGESGLVPKSELGYSGTSVARIRKVFTSRIRALSDGQIRTLKKDAEKFFDYVYHGPVGSKRYKDSIRRRGIGNTVGGYKYRGRGYIQHTGISNYQKLAKVTGFDYVNDPDLLNSPEHA